MIITPQIEAEEKKMKVTVAGAFAEHDENDDGFLSKEEFDKMTISECEKAGENIEVAKEIMIWEEMDVNKDNKISFEEYWDRTFFVYQKEVVKQMKI